jgi:hypothetical protein
MNIQLDPISWMCPITGVVSLLSEEPENEEPGNGEPENDVDLP